MVANKGRSLIGQVASPPASGKTAQVEPPPAQLSGRAEGPARREVFEKTRWCKFQAIGACTKGLECPFAHTVAELKKLPDLRFTKLCNTLIRTGSCDNPDCFYAHSQEELRANKSSSTYKTKPCRFFVERGHCSLGSKCTFAHDFSEVQLVPDYERGYCANLQSTLPNLLQHPHKVAVQSQQQVADASEPTVKRAAMSKEFALAFSLKCGLGPPPGLEHEGDDSVRKDILVAELERLGRKQAVLREANRQPASPLVALLERSINLAAERREQEDLWEHASTTDDSGSIEVDQKDGNVKIVEKAYVGPSKSPSQVSKMKPLSRGASSASTVCSLSSYLSSASLSSWEA